MIRSIILLGLAWVALMALAGGEFLISGAHMPQPDRPVVLVLAAVMVVIVAFGFMHLGRAPVVAKGFAVAALFWLIVLLGLGSMDALTRNLWLVQNYHPK